MILDVAGFKDGHQRFHSSYSSGGI
jgi:hypothetical protein